MELAHLAKVIASWTTGIGAGALMMGWYAIRHAKKPMTPSEVVRFHQIMNRYLSKAFPPLFISGGAALSYLLWSSRANVGGSFWLTVASLALLVAGVAITVGINVPINNAVSRWSIEAPPADHAVHLTKWDRFDTLRTFAVVLSFTLQVWLQEAT